MSEPQVIGFQYYMDRVKMPATGRRIEFRSAAPGFRLIHSYQAQRGRDNASSILSPEDLKAGISQQEVILIFERPIFAVEQEEQVSYPIAMRERGEADSAGPAFIAEVPDLPGCSGTGATKEEAFKDAARAIGEWIETAQKEGREIPRPSAPKLPEAANTDEKPQDGTNEA